MQPPIRSMTPDQEKVAQIFDKFCFFFIQELLPEFIIICNVSDPETLIQGIASDMWQAVEMRFYQKNTPDDYSKEAAS